MTVKQLKKSLKSEHIKIYKFGQYELIKQYKLPYIVYNGIICPIINTYIPICIEINTPQTCGIPGCSNYHNTHTCFVCGSINSNHLEKDCKHKR